MKGHLCLWLVDSEIIWSVSLMPCNWLATAIVLNTPSHKNRCSEMICSLVNHSVVTKLSANTDTATLLQSKTKFHFSEVISQAHSQTLSILHKSVCHTVSVLVRLCKRSVLNGPVEPVEKGEGRQCAKDLRQSCKQSLCWRSRENTLKTFHAENSGSTKKSWCSWSPTGQCRKNITSSLEWSVIRHCCLTHGLSIISQVAVQVHDQPSPASCLSTEESLFNSERMLQKKPTSSHSQFKA